MLLGALDLPVDLNLISNNLLEKNGASQGDFGKFFAKRLLGSLIYIII